MFALFWESNNFFKSSAYIYNKVLSHVIYFILYSKFTTGYLREYLIGL